MYKESSQIYYFQNGFCTKLGLISISDCGTGNQ